MTTPVRKALHAYLSDEAYETWHRFAEDRGISLGAVLTALGPALSDPTEMTTGQKLAAVITQAEEAERETRRARRKAIAERTVEKARRIQ
jgi:hypothetical protein